MFSLIPLRHWNTSEFSRWLRFHLCHYIVSHFILNRMTVNENACFGISALCLFAICYSVDRLLALLWSCLQNNWPDVWLADTKIDKPDQFVGWYAVDDSVMLLLKSDKRSCYLVFFFVFLFLFGLCCCCCCLCYCLYRIQIGKIATRNKIFMRNARSVSSIFISISMLKK